MHGIEVIAANIECILGSRQPLGSEGRTDTPHPPLSFLETEADTSSDLPARDQLDGTQQQQHNRRTHPTDHTNSCNPRSDTIMRSPGGARRTTLVSLCPSASLAPPNPQLTEPISHTKGAPHQLRGSSTRPRVWSHCMLGSMRSPGGGGRKVVSALRLSLPLSLPRWDGTECGPVSPLTPNLPNPSLALLVKVHCGGCWDGSYTACGLCEGALMPSLLHGRDTLPHSSVSRSVFVVHGRLALLGILLDRDADANTRFTPLHSFHAHFKSRPLIQRLLRLPLSTGQPWRGHQTSTQRERETDFSTTATG